jgi:sec-independent protein translocase protein TatA
MGLDSPTHIALLVVILLLLFGAKRLPEIGRSLGTSMREFKDSVSGESKPPAQAVLQQAAPPVPQAAEAPASSEQQPIAEQPRQG